MPKSKIKIFKGRKIPEVMNRTEGTLTNEEILEVIPAMTYEGLQLCAAGFLVASIKLKMTPAEVLAGLQEDL